LPVRSLAQISALAIAIVIYVLPTIGGTSMLVWMQFAFSRQPGGAAGLPRSRAWWLAAALTAAWAVAFFGPGIRFA
jgi:hypothetical protein